MKNIKSNNGIGPSQTIVDTVEHIKELDSCMENFSKVMEKHVKEYESLSPGVSQELGFAYSLMNGFIDKLKYAVRSQRGEEIDFVNSLYAANGLPPRIVKERDLFAKPKKKDGGKC